ncbi:unnamed protein product, partial [Anisakis simplex]|uniref:I/LWEQ domain-containing protein n=1 Tax=Anisakis simplex TaxID=6269 RepID=A0A0M3KI21_ANISI
MIPELALPSIRARIEQIDELTVKIGDEPDARLVHEMVVFGHELADLIVCSASAAYTVSIQHYEPVHEQCRLVAVEALGVVKTLKESNYAEAKGTFLPALKKCVEKLETLCKQLPTSNGDLDAEKVDALLEDEMKRMDAAIQKAVQMIEEMQKKSRATDSGIRLEVNEKILESCNALMAAIIELVKKSHAM